VLELQVIFETIFIEEFCECESNELNCILAKTYELISALSKHIPVDNLAAHFHDTYGMALANILVALQVGISSLIFCICI
jgi:isopropylmalate/homocitrate/citramalate synthase